MTKSKVYSPFYIEDTPDFSCKDNGDGKQVLYVDSSRTVTTTKPNGMGENQDISGIKTFKDSVHIDSGIEQNVDGQYVNYKVSHEKEMSEGGAPSVTGRASTNTPCVWKGTSMTWNDIYGYPTVPNGYSGDKSGLSSSGTPFSVSTEIVNSDLLTKVTISGDVVFASFCRAHVKPAQDVHEIITNSKCFLHFEQFLNVPNINVKIEIFSKDSQGNFTNNVSANYKVNVKNFLFNLHYNKYPYASYYAENLPEMGVNIASSGIFNKKPIPRNYYLGGTRDTYVELSKHTAGTPYFDFNHNLSLSDSFAFNYPETCTGGPDPSDLDGDQTVSPSMLAWNPWNPDTFDDFGYAYTTSAYNKRPDSISFSLEIKAETTNITTPVVGIIRFLQVTFPNTSSLPNTIRAGGEVDTETDNIALKDATVTTSGTSVTWSRTISGSIYNGKWIALHDIETNSSVAYGLFICSDSN